MKLRRVVPSTAATVAIGGVAVVRLASELWVTLTGSIDVLVRRTPDDAWYYLAVARSLAAGHGPTFDGHEATNGYHPLWQIIEAALATMFRGTALARAALVVSALLIVGSYALLVVVARRAIPISALGAACGALVLTSPPVWWRLCGGMEVPAVVATLAVLVAALDRWWRVPGWRAAVVVGLASGACVLARLPAVTSIALVPLAMLAIDGHRARPRADRGREVVGWLLACGAVVLGWVVASWASVGTPWPTVARIHEHGELLRSGPLLSAGRLRHAYAATAEDLWRQVLAALPPLAHVPALVRRLVEVAALVVVGWWAARVASRSARAALVVLVPVAALLLRMGVEVMVFPSWDRDWYTAPAYAVTALLVAVAVTVLLRRAAPHIPAPARGGSSVLVAAGVGLVALAVAAVIALGPSHAPSGSWGSANAEAAREVARRPGRPKVGAYDAGVVGWLAPGTVNMDGVVRGPRYVERLLRAPTPAGLAISEQLDLLVGRMPPGDARVPGCAVEVWRSPTIVELPGQGRLPVGIWDIRPCRGRS